MERDLVLTSTHLIFKRPCFLYYLKIGSLLLHKVLWYTLIRCFLWSFWGFKSFRWGHWYTCFGLLVMSALGFKTRVDPLHAFLLVWSSDLLLVWHLVTARGQHGSCWAFSIYILADVSNKNRWRFGAWTHDHLCHMQQARGCKQLGHSSSATVMWCLWI